MKIKNITLLITFALLFTFQTSLADQLTITFTNPVPTAPTNCGDTWSEQGIEINACNFTYGNGNLNFNNGSFNLYMLNLGLINKITFGIIINECCSEFSFYSGNTQIHYEIVGQSSIYEFENINNDVIDRVHFFGETNVIVLDITIDYTPVCEAEPIVNARSGDVYVDNDCHGIILTSPDGNCFRTRVNNNGTLFAEPVNCP